MLSRPKLILYYQDYHIETEVLYFLSVLWIRDIFVRIQILRSVPLTDRSGCGYGRRGPKTKVSYGSGFRILVHLHHSSKIKSHKKVTKQQKSRVFLPFLLDAPEPDLYLWLTDPDTDPQVPKKQIQMQIHKTVFIFIKNRIRQGNRVPSQQNNLLQMVHSTIFCGGPCLPVPLAERPVLPTGRLFGLITQKGPTKKRSGQKSSSRILTDLKQKEPNFWNFCFLSFIVYCL